MWIGFSYDADDDGRVVVHHFGTQGAARIGARLDDLPDLLGLLRATGSAAPPRCRSCGEHVPVPPLDEVA
jgi:hypothetical protein